MPATYLVGRAPLAGPLPYGTGPSGDLTVPVIKAKRSAPSSWRRSIHPCRSGRRRQESRTCHGLWRWRESNLSGGVWTCWSVALTCGNVEDVSASDGSDCPDALTASTVAQSHELSVSLNLRCTTMPSSALMYYNEAHDTGGDSRAEAERLGRRRSRRRRGDCHDHR